MDKRAAIANFIETELVVTSDDVKVNFDDDLLLTGLVSSLDIMRLVAFVEEAYEVSIPAEDIVIDHFISIDAMHNYLQNRVTES